MLRPRVTSAMPRRSSLGTVLAHPPTLQDRAPRQAAPPMQPARHRGAVGTVRCAGGGERESVRVNPQRADDDDSSSALLILMPTMIRLALMMLAIVPQLCCGLWRGHVVGIDPGRSAQAVRSHDRHHGVTGGHHHGHHDHHHDHAVDRGHGHVHGGALFSAAGDADSQGARDGSTDDSGAPCVPDHLHVDADDARVSRSSFSVDPGVPTASPMPPVAMPAHGVSMPRCDGGNAHGVDRGGGRAPPVLHALRTVRLQV